MKPFKPEQVKTFRAPKYGGVTLSLLSMFVLGSMMVVWKKIGEKKGQEPVKESIRVLCDESIALPVKQCAEQFEREMKIKVSIHSTSGFEQNGFRPRATGNNVAYDLHLSTLKSPAEHPSPEQVPCAFRSIVFATRKDFSTDLVSLEQVFQNNLTYSTSTDSAKDARLLERILRKSAKWTKTLSKRKKVYQSSSAAAIELTSVNDLDGAFMWDFSARKFDLKIHRFKELETASETIFAGTNVSAENRIHALQFARFLAAPTKGQFYFAKEGFVGVNGDAWSEKPFLYVYCANELKNLILAELDRFEEAALVSIEPHFIDQEKITITLGLIAQSKARKSLPDLVFGLPESQNTQMPNQYQPSLRTLMINDVQIPVYTLKSTRLPSTARRLFQFLQTREEANN